MGAGGGGRAPALDTAIVFRKRREGTKSRWPAALDGVDRSGWVQKPGGSSAVPACTATSLGQLFQPLAPEKRTETVKQFPLDSSKGSQLASPSTRWC